RHTGQVGLHGRRPPLRARGPVQPVRGRQLSGRSWMEATSIDWWDAALRLLAAAGLGGVIGLEREADGQAAGFRTHLLLALGAALFGLVSVGAFEDFTARRGETNVNID